MNLKTVLITISIVAAVLIAITFYVVFFSSSGTYVVNSLDGQNGDIFGSGNPAPVASTTPSSTLAFTPASTGSSTASSTEPGDTTSSTESTAAPVTWTQGGEIMTITAASLSGSQLTLGVQVTMGPSSECVPLTMRLIADEQGTLSPPVTSQFTFPDTGTCNGTAGETYSAQPVVFTLADPNLFPIILTTGGTANLLFEVDQNPDGTLTAQLPSQAG